MMRHRFRLTAASIAAVLLAGCAATGGVRQAEREYDDRSGEATNLRGQMPTAAPPAPPRETVRFVETPIVATRPLRSSSRPIPPELDCRLNFASGPLSIMGFSQQVARDCGIPVRVTPDAVAHVNSAGIGASAPGAAPAAAGFAPPAGLPLPALPSLGGSSASSDPSLIDLPPPGYTGPLAGLLDVVTSRYGLNWRFNGRAVELFYLDTRQFSIRAFDSGSEMSADFQTGITSSPGVSGGGGSSGGGSAGGASGGSGGGTIGSTQSTRITSRSQLYADLEATVKSMLTPAGRLAFNRTTGTLTVTDAPEALDRIGTYLDRENEALGQQLVFHVRVLQIELDNNAEAGVDWTGLYENLAGNYGVALRSPWAAASNAGNLGFGVLDTATGSAARFSGSNVLVSALSSYGRVSTVISPSVATANLLPAPIQYTDQIGYIPQTSTSQVANAGTTTGAQVGYITAGFNMQITPRIVDGDEVMMQMSLSISALNGPIERREVAPDTFLDVPSLAVRQFFQTITVKAGETVVMHGFEQTSFDGTRQGTVSPFAWLMGGGMRSRNARTQLVITVTPVIQG